MKLSAPVVWSQLPLKQKMFKTTVQPPPPTELSYKVNECSMHSRWKDQAKKERTGHLHVPMHAGYYKMQNCRRTGATSLDSFSGPKCLMHSSGVNLV